MLALIDIDPHSKRWVAGLLGASDMPEDDVRDYLRFAAEFQGARPFGVGGMFVAVLPDA